jgi:hypothetical protein
MSGIPMRVAAGMGVVAMAVMGVAGPAQADHTHAKVVGNDQCVILAQGGGEKYVVLPAAVFANNPNVDAPAGNATRSHPLHVLVHLGVPGENQAIYVLGSPQANAACAAGYVND